MKILRGVFMLLYIVFLDIANVVDAAGLNAHIQAETLSLQLLNISASALGAKYIQGEFDRASFISKAVFEDIELGDQLASKLANQLSQRFGDRIDAVKNIKREVEDAYTAGSFESSQTYRGRFPQCCHLNESMLIEYDPRISMKLDYDSICMRVSGDAPDQYTVPLHENIFMVMKNNLQKTDTIKWQYFGTEEGIFVKYPAHITTPCDAYYNRYRPWYVETATPIAKDLVLVIDRSGSMGDPENNRMEIAKEAAKTVIDTLNPNDRIGIVEFSTDASTPPGSPTSVCYNRELAFATPDNTKYLKSYVDRIQSGGQTDYLDALKKAFGLVVETKNPESLQPRKKAILFLTDGKPTTGTNEIIIRQIATLNGAVNNTVTLMTYGLGEDLEEEAKELLQNMSMQIYSDPSKGPISRVAFTEVPSSENLRQQLGSYYSQFSVASIDKPIVSVPYVDFSGLGLITSICLPIYHPQYVLKGVSCVDVRMADIIGDIEYFQPGEFAYTFIIDDTGRTLLHPLLPSPFRLNDDAFFLDISDLERESEAREIISSMKNGESGHKSFRTRIVTSRGDVSRVGVQSENVMARYHWHSIEGTSFSVCMVFTDQDKDLNISKSGNAKHFVHNRFDVVEPTNTCKVLSRIATAETSSIKFTPSAYIEPYRAIDNALSKDDVQRATNFMKTTGYSLDWFKVGVKDIVVLMEAMDDFWKNRRRELKANVIWSYFGTYNGVMRTYPGVSLAIEYDHTKRDWYDNARAHKDQLVLTPPYEDAFGAGTVISFVHTVLEGKGILGTHSSTDMVVGVVGLDIKMSFIHFFIKGLFAECGQNYTCFLVDDTGTLVYHEKFLSGQLNFDSSYHLSRLEPDIATYLIKQNVMKRERCVSLGKKVAHQTWILELQSEIDLLDSQPGFRFQKVRQTNLFFGVKKPQGSFTHTCMCTHTSQSQSTCKSLDPDDCECPCVSSVLYAYCENSYAALNENEITCTAEKMKMNLTSPIVNEAEKANMLMPCFGVVCSDYTTESACGLVGTCNWCHKSQNSQKSCITSNLCIKVEPITTLPEQTTESIDSSTESSGEGGLSPTIIAAIASCVVVIGVLAVVVVVLVVFLKRRRRMKNEGSTKVIYRQDGGETASTVTCNPSSSVPGSLGSSTPDIHQNRKENIRIRQSEQSYEVPLQEEGPSRQDASQQTLQRQLPDVPVNSRDIVDQYLTTNKDFMPPGNVI